MLRKRSLVARPPVLAAIVLVRQFIALSTPPGLIPGRSWLLHPFRGDNGPNTARGELLTRWELSFGILGEIPVHPEK
jgi:hypothetical protein